MNNDYDLAKIYTRFEQIDKELKELRKEFAEVKDTLVLSKYKIEDVVCYYGNKGNTK